jgi:hypothetical protein
VEEARGTLGAVDGPSVPLVPIEYVVCFNADGA